MKLFISATLDPNSVPSNGRAEGKKKIVKRWGTRWRWVRSNKIPRPHRRHFHAFIDGRMMKGKSTIARHSWVTIRRPCLQKSFKCSVAIAAQTKKVNKKKTSAPDSNPASRCAISRLFSRSFRERYGKLSRARRKSAVYCFGVPVVGRDLLIQIGAVMKIFVQLPESHCRWPGRVWSE